MTPEHHALLLTLATAGRLGPFCPFPLPDGYQGDPTIIPKTTKLGQEAELPEMSGRLRLADPGFVARNWKLLAERDRRLADLLPPCPHCGADDVYRRPDGIDHCRACQGDSFEGMTFDDARRAGRGPLYRSVL